MNVQVQRTRPKGICFVSSSGLNSEIEGTTCLHLEEKLRISKIITLAEALNAGKSMGYESWHHDRIFFFLFFRFFFPPSLVVPVTIYSHNPLCFYHLQKGLASWGRSLQLLPGRGAGS